MSGTSSLPYDVVFTIYFHVDDYQTAQNFWTLNKTFNQAFMEKYNTAYLHLFNLLYTSLFQLFSTFPSYDGVLDIGDLLGLQTSRNRNNLKRDISFVYNLYRTFIAEELRKQHNYNNLIRRAGPSIVDMCMIQGPKYLNSYCTIHVVKSKIRLKSLHTSNTMNKGYLLSCNRQSTYRYIKEQFIAFEHLVYTQV